jgi:hypothetical protein
MDADLRSRLAAYRNAQPDGPPTAWTPEHVQLRYTDALRIVGRLPVAHAGSGGGWPSLLQDMAKAVDAEARRTLHAKALDEAGIARADEIEPAVVFASDRPTPDQVSRAEEAIAWPLAYLQDYPKGADAFTLFCYGRAFRSFEIAPFLRERLRQAEVLAQREADEINNRSPEHAKARAKRLQLAKEVNAILNGWLATAEDEDHATIMKREAILLLRNWCAEAGVLPVQPRAPHLVCPDFVLQRERMDHHRKRAARQIAAALQEARVRVR